MSKALPTFEERLRNPGLEIINFSYLAVRPEAWPLVREKYIRNYTFRTQVDQKRRLDVVFDRKFRKMFPGIDENINKSHLSK